MSGGFHPKSFHVVNIALHGGICVLLVDVFSVLFGGLQYTSKGRRLNLAPRSSLLAALLFAVHPVHTECVSTVCQPSLPLCKIDAVHALVCSLKQASLGCLYGSRRPAFRHPEG